MTSQGEYKSSKEAFVSGMSGSSIWHVNLVSFVALSKVATTYPFSLLGEFIILAIPLLLSVTVFAESPIWLNIVLLALTAAVCFIFPRKETGTVLPVGASSPTLGPGASIPSVASIVSGGNTGRSVACPNEIPPLPALTTYRAHMLLLTAICILAVDFPVFPRSLAKCETFGVSIMDLGVGSFVFSQGVVSALPIIKNPTYLTSPLVPKLTTVLRKCLPLLLLGLLRTVSVKGTEYPEHQTEYGTHWNFFITLGLLPLMQVLLHPFMVYLPISLVGVIVAISHQLTLSSGGLSVYVLHAPRTSLVSANKEGLVSLTGYLAIHLMGLSTGTLVLPPSPSYFRRQQESLRKTRRNTISQPPEMSSLSAGSSSGYQPSSAQYQSHSHSTTTVVPTPASLQEPIKRENDRTAIELCSYAVLWWVSLGAMKLLGIGGGVSRRMVNLQYITWVIAYNTTFILGYLLLDLIFFPSPLSKSVYSPNSGLKVTRSVALGAGSIGPETSARQQEGHKTTGSVSSSHGQGGAPMLLEAINKNGLVLFLLANVATGLINLTIQTMYVKDGWAMVILTLYSFALCAVAWSCRGRKLWRF
ncbi:hypothetical protein K474DRAFT_1686168 [Panus rudis PR-1116 ss-1]|nr:hypothetical protein K474DRAFT_1686168 [Panus rudis PR-1116 ss-1]